MPDFSENNPEQPITEKFDPETLEKIHRAVLQNKYNTGQTADVFINFLKGNGFGVDASAAILAASRYLNSLKGNNHEQSIKILEFELRKIAKRH